MKKLVLTIFLVISSISLSQDFKVADTISTVILQKFKAPADKQIVLTNTRSIQEFSAKILDQNGGLVKNLDDVYQMPKTLEGGTRGETVVFEVYGMLEEAGDYIINITLKFTDETGRRSADIYYALKVDNPTMAQKVNVREKYYPTEKVTFSFATSEYSDPMGYSYEIVNSGGTVVDTGRGSIVTLDEMLKKDEFVGQNFTIVGKYNDREFSFKEFGGDALSESNWQFSVANPQLSFFGTWKNLSDEQQDAAGAQYYISPLNPNQLKFYFIYTGVTGDGSLVATPAKIRNLRIVSEPEGFLNAGRGGQARTSGNFGILFLDINQDFLDQMEFCDDVGVKLNVKFSTQYESNITYEFEAIVIK